MLAFVSTQIAEYGFHRCKATCDHFFSQISINLEYHFINGADTRASFSKSRLMDVRCHIVTLWFGLLAANIFLKYMCP